MDDNRNDDITVVSRVLSAHGRLNINSPHGHLPGTKIAIEAATSTP